MNPCDPLVLTMNNIAERNADGAERKLGCVVEPPPWAAYDAWLKRKKQEEFDAKLEKDPKYEKKLAKCRRDNKMRRKRWRENPKLFEEELRKRKEWHRRGVERRQKEMAEERRKKLEAAGIVE